MRKMSAAAALDAANDCTLFGHGDAATTVQLELALSRRSGPEAPRTWVLRRSASHVPWGTMAPLAETRIDDAVLLLVRRLRFS